jgi:hypothetical protein
MMKFEISDWVQGKTVEGEFIQGYIETTDDQRDLVRVRVVQSDHEAAVGKTVTVHSSWLKQLPLNSLNDRKNIESLIDLALATYDETWFNELTDRLNSLQHEGKSKLKTRVRGTLINRLGLFENK